MTHSRLKPMGIVRLAVCCATLACMLGAIGAVSASAAEPWWHVSPTSRPTNLWAAKPEVQEVTGALTELRLDGKFVACVGSASFFCSGATGHAGTTSAAELQAQLEAAYGLTGGVEVSEPTVGNYVIKTPGRFVSDLEAELGGTVTVQGGSGRLAVIVTNLGDAPADGATSPVRIVDALPAGIVATHVEAPAGTQGHYGQSSCSVEAGGVVACTFSEALPSYESIEMEIDVAVTSSTPVEGTELGAVTVSGGGAPAVSVPQRLRLSSSPTPFGVESYSFSAEEEGGAPDTRAGSHPFQLTTVVNLNQGPISGARHDAQTGEEQPKLPRNLRFRLPAGLVGNATAEAQCSEADFSETQNGPNLCPADTAVGVAAITFIEKNFGLDTLAVPVFNLVPTEGEPARFGFTVDFVPVILNTSVLSGEGYNVLVNVEDITELPAFLRSILTFWGAPGSHSHDSARGSDCVYAFAQVPCTRPENLSEKPFLRLPTSCGVELGAPMEAEPWNVPLGSEVLTDSASSAALGGCNQVPFEPGIATAPDVQNASSPSGLTVHVHVPQNENPNGLAESDVRDLTVTLPEGVALNPSDANGLESCSETQIGFTGSKGSELRFTPTAPSCPDSSKVGTVVIHSPLLPNPLEGAMYLATPTPNGESGMNPYNSLLAMYIVARDPVSGTLVKSPVKVIPNPVTGQLTAYSEEIPQLPFEDLELHFFGGGRSPLSTPPRCGSYTTSASFEPWSGGEPVQASSVFEITSGPNGSACPSPLPFAPSLTAGTTSIQAGGLSPFTMTMSREDGNQNLQAITLKMPPGLSGLLTGVKLCPEAQANAGTCSPESQIGETTVSVGLGNEPFTVTGGKVYLTEKYGSAPFGLSIVNPANAGPFHLGNVIVRAKIEVNPITAELTITSDNSGPYKIPTIIDGIPLEIKHVNVTINRPGFTFNPTNCNPTAITGSLHSTESATSALSVPFQVTNCATLAFKPGFKVSTSGKTSRADGASLSVKLTYPKAPFGSQANIKSVKVDLPKQLPSRLTTLQKACPAKTFEANPAGCPADSIVGHGTAITPLIPVPLAGPAYFVSYGGAKFPELVIALQGYGVTLDLHGETFINSAGITSSTFRTVPDAPVGSFELSLPEGPYSALAATGNLCASTKTTTVKKKVTVRVHGRKRTVTREVKQSVAASLVMPTLFLAQNGAEIKQNTSITTTGCGAKAKKAKAKKVGRAAHKGTRSKK